MQSLKALIRFKLRGKPPIFSSFDNISIKSPKSIQGKLIEEDNSSKRFYNNLSLAKLREAYITVRRKV